MKLKSFITLLPTILFFGCASDPIIDSESAQQPIVVQSGIVYTSNNSTSVNSLSLSNVIAGFSRNNPSSRASLKEVKEIIPIKADDCSTLMYIINYTDNEGFIIISGNKDYEPILAYSDEGCINMEDAYNSGLAIWLEEQKSILQNPELIPEDKRAEFVTKWRNLDVTETTYTAPVDSRASEPSYIGNLINAQLRAWQQEGCEVYVLEDFRNSQEFQSFPSSVQNDFLNLPYGYAYKYASGGQYAVSFVLKRTKTNVHSEIGPLCKTTWRQAYGFNSSHPNYDPNNNGDWPLGCSTIAVAQTMMKHKYPFTIPWDSFPLTSYNSALCDFLYDLAKNYIKIADDGGANNEKIKTALTNYRYNVKLIDHYDNGKTNLSLTSNLNDGYPVIMTGLKDSTSGHAWVCDGFDSYSYSWVWELWCLEDCPESYDPQNFSLIIEYAPMTSFAGITYHMNWGWGGRHDGFYADTNISTPQGNFSLSRKDFVDVYPK